MSIAWLFSAECHVISVCGVCGRLLKEVFGSRWCSCEWSSPELNQNTDRLMLLRWSFTAMVMTSEERLSDLVIWHLIIDKNVLWNVIVTSYSTTIIYSPSLHCKSVRLSTVETKIWYFEKRHLLCFSEERKSYGFGTTRGWNDDRMIILRVNYPSKIVLLSYWTINSFNPVINHQKGFCLEPQLLVQWRVYQKWFFGCRVAVRLENSYVFIRFFRSVFWCLGSCKLTQ